MQMRIVEINTLPNGGHRNQSGEFKNIPEGYAIIPEGIKTENFPFGEVKAEEIDGVMTVTEWIPGIVPEPEPEPEKEITAEEMLNALVGGMSYE